MTAAALIAALALGIAHPPAPPQGCSYIVPMIAVTPPPVMAGNMRTVDGGCLIWANLNYASALRRRDACKLAEHELGHLAGLPHSTDPLSVMYSPFQARPRAPGC